LNSGQCPLFCCVDFFQRPLTLNSLKLITPSQWLALLFMCPAAPLCWGQLAPSGYSGALNTPVADTLPVGSAELTLTKRPLVVRRIFQAP
jgi:hypothetical protein